MDREPFLTIVLVAGKTAAKWDARTKTQSHVIVVERPLLGLVCSRNAEKAK
jgi:hypothetical protein